MNPECSNSARTTIGGRWEPKGSLALIERGGLTSDESQRLVAEMISVRDAVWGDAVWGDAVAAVWDAARDAARSASLKTAAFTAAFTAAMAADSDAASALVVRDIISTKHYDALTMPWRTVIGPIHPDDPDNN